MIELTEEQRAVHDSVVDWYKSNPDRYISVGGLAGCGKTTVIGFIADTLKREFGTLPIAYVCYTGKASLVLARKLKNLDFNDSVGTIHSLIYKPIVDEDGSILGWARKDDVDASLIIVDEASMVDKDIWRDLTSYGIPILAVGDHGQLPPIGEGGFSLMRNPDLKLVTVHRQALENPIIKLSLYVRRHGSIPTRVFGKTAAKLDYSIDQRAKDILYGYDFRTDSQILCGMNKTRVKLNDLVRGTNGFDCDDPLPGEKLICLKNNRELGIMNGQMGVLNEAKFATELLFDLNITMDGLSGPINALTHRNAFGSVKYDVAMKELYADALLAGLPYDKKPKINMFDFGYAISIHKAQGSEFQRVVLIEERNSFQSDDDYTRWLYTGITRASEKLVIIDNFY